MHCPLPPLTVLNLARISERKYFKLEKAAKQAGKRKEEILTKPLEWDEEALLNIQKHATEQVTFPAILMSS